MLWQKCKTTVHKICWLTHRIPNAKMKDIITIAHKNNFRIERLRAILIFRRILSVLFQSFLYVFILYITSLTTTRLYICLCFCKSIILWFLSKKLSLKSFGFCYHILLSYINEFVYVVMSAHIKRNDGATEKEN